MVVECSPASQRAESGMGAGETITAARAAGPGSRWVLPTLFSTGIGRADRTRRAKPLVAAVSQYAHRDPDDAVGDPDHRLVRARPLLPVLRADRVRAGR